MGYYMQTYKTGAVIEVEKRQTLGRPREIFGPRAPKQKPTPDQMFAINERNAANNLRRILNANFGEDDYHVVLKYKPGEHPDP